MIFIKFMFEANFFKRDQLLNVNCSYLILHTEMSEYSVDLTFSKITEPGLCYIVLKSMLWPPSGAIVASSDFFLLLWVMVSSKQNKASVRPFKDHF